MARREHFDKRNHGQPGDPAKLGKVFVHLSRLENPPVSFLAGPDAIQWGETAVENRKALIEAYRELSASTDGDW